MKNEEKAYINYLRKKYGKKNGVIPSMYFDSLFFDVKVHTSNRIYQRQPKHRDFYYGQADS